MKFRLALSVTVVAALFLSLSGAQAAPPVMDGKRIKVISKTVAPGPRQAVSADELSCKAPDCLVIPFVYAPAKGIKGGLMFTVTWTNPVSDMDLYVIEVDSKTKKETVVGSCGTGPSAVEKVYLSPKQARPGKTYRMVVKFFLSANETVNAKVEINVPNRIPNTVPSQVEARHATNCGL